MANTTNSILGLGRQSAFRSQKGFSLIELMCVIAIMSVVASAAWPAIVGVVSGDRLTNNAYELSGLIQQARTTAITQHTYVGLGFYSLTQNGAPSLMVATVSGISGLATDLQSSTTYQLSAKPVILKNVTLAAVANYTALPGLDSVDNTDAGSQTYSFKLNVPGTSNATFSDMIVFGPDGQVWLPTNSGTLPQWPDPCVGVGLNAAPSPANNLRTVAVQVHGLSGQTSVFQQ